jgi:hypothetical protein
MTDLLIEFHFDRDKASSQHILKIKLELQRAVKNLNAQGISISNPNLVAHEGDIKRGK